MIVKSLLFVSLLGICNADTVKFNNGAILNGKVTEQNNATLTIDVDGQKTTYSKSDIKEVQIDPVVSAPPPPPAMVSAPPSQKSNELVVKSGTQVHVKSLTLLDSSKHHQGHQFKMELESDLLSKDQRVVAPRGSEVYGSVIQSEQARRLTGKSAMIISLNAISIDNKRVNISTNKINILAADKQGKNTFGKVARGAAIGALVNGSSGANNGAKVGLGAAILTKGQATGVAPGTLMSFTLGTDLILR